MRNLINFLDLANIAHIIQPVLKTSLNTLLEAVIIQNYSQKGKEDINQDSLINKLAKIQENQALELNGRQKALL